MTKSRVEACREPVLRASREGSVVTCSEARWICSSDAECGKALEYYNLFCRAMFRGRKCTQHCRNSLDILRRQEKAQKLVQCKYVHDGKKITLFPKLLRTVPPSPGASPEST